MISTANQCGRVKNELKKTERVCRKPGALKQDVDPQPISKDTMCAFLFIMCYFYFQNATMHH